MSWPYNNGGWPTYCYTSNIATTNWMPLAPVASDARQTCWAAIKAAWWAYLARFEWGARVVIRAVVSEREPWSAFDRRVPGLRERRKGPAPGTRELRRAIREALAA